MPELPEVHTVATALAKQLTGRCFTRIETFKNLRYPLELAGREELTGAPITLVRRRGRYIIIELKNLECLIIHLGMSGSIRIVEPGAERGKHEHVVFYLDNAMTMRFDCPRRFGFIRTCRLSAAGQEPESLKGLGLEPLHDEFNAEYLFKRSRRRSGMIKNFIMDNKIVTGVGNIYATEALFMSRIRPQRRTGSLSRRECEKLTAAIKVVLAEAIEHGGTTISDYRSVDGSEGKFALRLQMYGRHGLECRECGREIEKLIIGGRSSCFCPNCQK